MKNGPAFTQITCHKWHICQDAVKQGGKNRNKLTGAK